MKQFSEEENNLKCKVENRKSWWEIKLKLDMKTHLLCLKHLAKKKCFFERKWKGKACICRNYLICYLLTSPFKLIFFLLFLTSSSRLQVVALPFLKSNLKNFYLGKLLVCFDRSNVYCL